MYLHFSSILAILLVRGDTNSSKTCDPYMDVEPNEPRHIQVGKNQTYICRASSDVSLKWRKRLGNGTFVPVADNKVSDSVHGWDVRNLVMTIKNAQKSDSGVYKCLMTIEGKPCTKAELITLKVLDYASPAIISHSGQTTAVVVRSSDPTTIQCTVEGYPRPTISWFRNAKEIAVPGCNITAFKRCKGSNYSLSLNSSSIMVTEGNLTILKPTFPGDHGTYTCLAQNAQESSNATIFVDVLAQPRITNIKTREMEVTLGTTVNKTCSATGNPLPEIVWTRTNDPNGEVLKNGKGKAFLVVENVKKEDLGNYTCNATNSVKSVIAVFTLKGSIGEGNFREDETNPKGLSTSVFIGIVGGAVLIILLVIVVCFILYRRQKNKTKQYKNLYFMRTRNTKIEIDPGRSLFEQCNNLPYDLDWEFPEERLVLGITLGAGAFGLVLKAEAIGMPAFKPRDKTPEGRKSRAKIRRSKRRSIKRSDGNRSLRSAAQTVAVKTLKEGASENDYKDLASELKILIHLGEHKNIVNVLGACTRGRRLMVIIEYAPHGDLLSFLRSKRDIYDPNWVKTSNNPDQEFTLVDLGMVAYQISRGMEFLASKKCVHRDLAARNVLVGYDYVMKISDFGLARDVYQDDLYVKTTSGLLPVKWMAMESLFDRVYTEKSDVWSFGIVLWEIFTLGASPYPSVALENLLECLNEGYRMQQPPNCPPEMYAIMKECWQTVPEERPSFVDLVAKIRRILEKKARQGNLDLCLETDELPKAGNCHLTPNGSGQGRQMDSLTVGLPRASNEYEHSPTHSRESLANTYTSKCNTVEENGKCIEMQQREEKEPLFRASLTQENPKYMNQHESTV